MEDFIVVTTDTISKIENQTSALIVAILIFAFIIFGILAVIFSSINKYKLATIFFILAIVIFVALGLLKVIEPKFIYTDITQYTGYVPDNITYNDFIKRYKIIRVANNLTTVELNNN